MSETDPVKRIADLEAELAWYRFPECRKFAINQALERAAEVCEQMQPAGGRAWTEDQALCYAVLSDAAKNIRALKT